MIFKRDLSVPEYIYYNYFLKLLYVVAAAGL